MVPTLTAGLTEVRPVEFRPRVGEQSGRSGLNSKE